VRGVRFDGCDLADCEFVGCDLQGASFGQLGVYEKDMVKLTDATFEDCSLVKASLLLTMYLLQLG